MTFEMYDSLVKYLNSPPPTIIVAREYAPKNQWDGLPKRDIPMEMTEDAINYALWYYTPGEILFLVYYLLLPLKRLTKKKGENYHNFELSKSLIENWFKDFETYLNDPGFVGNLDRAIDNIDVFTKSSRKEKKADTKISLDLYILDHLQTVLPYLAIEEYPERSIKLFISPLMKLLHITYKDSNEAIKAWKETVKKLPEHENQIRGLDCHSSTLLLTMQPFITKDMLPKFIDFFSAFVRKTFPAGLHKTVYLLFAKTAMKSLFAITNGRSNAFTPLQVYKTRKNDVLEKEPWEMNEDEEIDFENYSHDDIIVSLKQDNELFPIDLILAYLEKIQYEMNGESLDFNLDHKMCLILIDDSFNEKSLTALFDQDEINRAYMQECMQFIDEILIWDKSSTNPSTLNDIKGLIRSILRLFPSHLSFNDFAHALKQHILMTFAFCFDTTTEIEA